MPHFRRLESALLVFALFAVLLVCAGCKDKAADPQIFVSAQTALEEGLTAYKNKDYQAAVASFDQALAAGGLLPDLYSEALLKRAECNGRLGNFDLAHVDLDKAARGGDMAEVHRVRSFVFQKEGRTTESKAELSKARQINAGIKAIVE